MADEKVKCPEDCPEGTVLKDGKCVLPEVTFTAFIMSLSTSALLHLGEIADPSTGAKLQDLMLAKHAIDTLAMLKEKTKGNLSQDEKGLLENLVYDLKMKYVQAKK